MRLTVSRIHLSVGRLQPPDALIEHADDDLVAVLLQLGSEAECAPDAALDRWRRARPLAIYQPGQALGQVRIGDNLRRHRLPARLRHVKTARGFGGGSISPAPGLTWEPDPSVIGTPADEAIPRILF